MLQRAALLKHVQKLWADHLADTQGQDRVQQHREADNAQDLGVDVAPRLQTVKVEEPPKRKGGVMVSSIEELVDKLKNEAKVL